MSRENLEKLITKHSQRLQKLKEQQATMGLNTPPHILIEIEEIEATLAKLRAELAASGEEGGPETPRNQPAAMIAPPKPRPEVADPKAVPQPPSESSTPLPLDLSTAELLQLHLPDETLPLSPDRAQALLGALAQVCQLSPQAMRILGWRAEGGWLGLALPQVAAGQLVTWFAERDPALGPLLAQFRPADISRLSLELPYTGLADFGPAQHLLVKLLYLGTGRVLIEQELSGGYGGAQVLLVQPIDRQGQAMARQIVKLSRGPDLQIEYDNYLHGIKNYLPQTAARVDQYAAIEGLAGLIYSFVGDGMLGQPRTLEAYYRVPQTTPAEIIQCLKDLLEAELGQRWYSQSRPDTFFLDREYGRHLVEHLRLRLRPGSDDGLWPDGQAPAPTASYQPVAPEALVSTHGTISPGTLVQVTGLTVSRVKYHEIKLQHPTNPGIVLKVEGPPAGFRAFSAGDRVAVRGQVLFNRAERLAEIVSAAFAGFSGGAVDLQGERLTWLSGQAVYPNPLQLYPSILSRAIAGRKSRVHGDLHLRNILVDRQGRGWLIDFARVEERHNLFDFIKLETYLRQMVLSQAEADFSWAAYLQFEEALVAASLGQSARPPNSPALQRAFEVILALRQMAAHFMGHPPNFHGEYFPALFLYNLAVLKYYDNHGAKATRLAFATAAVVGRALGPEQGAASPGPVSQSSPEVPPADPPANFQTERCRDLAENIRETLKLIKAYEDQQRLAGDPKARLRAAAAIKTLRSDLAEYQTEYSSLGCR